MKKKKLTCGIPLDNVTGRDTLSLSNFCTLKIRAIRVGFKNSYN
jgi:hypothetical protein